MNSTKMHTEPVEALWLDIIVQWPGHAFAHELLLEAPARWSLTGCLVPETASVQHRSDDGKSRTSTVFDHNQIFNLSRRGAIVEQQ